MIKINAKQLPQQLGPAAWDAILPPRPANPVLRGALCVDVTIIGGGFAGLAAARRLRQLDPNVKIAVLEAGQVAQGAAGRNSGFMIDLPHELNSEDYSGAGDDRQIILLNRQAQDFAAAAVDDYEISPDFFDRAGKINGAASEMADAHNRSYAQHLQNLKEPSERLDAAHMRELTGSAHYLSGLYTPGTVMLQPAGFIRGMADGVARDGAKIYENTPATGFMQKTGGWRVTTPMGHIDTGRIIMTVNGHLESFGFERGALMHLFLFAVMSPELDPKQIGGAERWGITPSDPMGTTIRRINTGQGGNRIITRTCAALRSNMVPRGNDLKRAAKVMQQKFDSRFAQLAGLKMQYAWAGHLCLSLNSVSVMRELAPGVFSGCVQNGLGTARGTLTGIGAAELACGVTSDITRHFCAEPRAKPLPPKPIRDIGANAVLRWKEWKARAD